MRRAWLLSLALVALGCGGLPTGETYEYLAGSPELAMASTTPEGVWQSSPWSGPDVRWLPYPPQGTIVVEHGLGRVPAAVGVWISFEEDGDAPAPSSGDLSRLISIDETFVAVRNSTNVRLWTRITLQ
ncbi:MAG: hypothetical protein KF729_16635 [Sandaracinaceae bacterium]|nr:hypothetical protein [Sandaracinaceae bacterium]